MSRLALSVHGIVQGVGFRPFAHKAARAHGLIGWVKNGRDGVQLEIQGRDRDLSEFLRTLQRDLPAAARIDRLDRRRIDENDDSEDRDFCILEGGEHAPAEPVLPADLAPCAACLADMADPSNRRYRYPFTHCTQCGPRYTIVEKLPYDRPNTGMRQFSLCDSCAREYDDPSNRRHHAQPIACPDCGPQLALLTREGTPLANGDAALVAAAARLIAGELVALRGVGGYQLLALASSDKAVQRLRQNKGRPDKPFAVMFGSLDQLHACGTPTADELQWLTAPAAPIVLIAARRHHFVAAAVCGDSRFIGAMLPTSPIHELLLEQIGAPIVCTSGNIQEEPLCSETADAIVKLGPIVDALLDHDRPIVRAMDDSVLQRSGAGHMQLLRRARGYTPLPVAQLPADPSVLGLGAHLKSTVALGHRGRLLLSQHLGDLTTARSRDLLAQTAHDLCSFYSAEPAMIACDLHPDYASSRLAERLAQRLERPLWRVQHQHAHIGAVMAEHQLSGDVLGFAFDGVGLGDDSTIWGGEALACNGAHYRRYAHLGQFRLPGGERAMRSPRRAALGLLAAAKPDALERAQRWFDRNELRVLRRALDSEINSPLCSSAGRLVDAVAALLDLTMECSYEGQAALALEACAARCQRSVSSYPLPLIEGDGGGPASGSLSTLVDAILHDLARGVEAPVVALRFHLALVEFGVAIAQRAQLHQVALGGGCFANRILSGRLTSRLRQEGFAVYAGQLIPPGDNGIAAGQVWLSMQAAHEQEGQDVFGHSR